MLSRSTVPPVADRKKWLVLQAEAMGYSCEFTGTSVVLRSGNNITVVITGETSDDAVHIAMDEMLRIIGVIHNLG